MHENEQARMASANGFADRSKLTGKESIAKRLLRYLFPDQRKQSRFAGPPLMAYLGTMRGSRPFEVGDVGLGGFSLVTSERWEPGTEMPVTLERLNAAENEPNDRFTVQATAVRWTEDGVGFSIVLFEEESNAVSDNPLHIMWASRQEMKQFLERLKTPEEVHSTGATQPHGEESTLQAAFNARFHQVSPHTAGD